MFALHLLACTPPAPTLAGALSELDPHAAVFTVDAAATLRCIAGDDALRLPLMPDTPTPLRGLLADTTYTCAATDASVQSNTVTLTPPPLPDDFPAASVTVPGDAAEVGLHLVNLARLLAPDGSSAVFFSGEHLAVLDAEGRPRWRQDGEGGGDIDVTWLRDGTLLYGGFGGDASTAPTIRTLDGDVLLEAPVTTDTPWEVPASWHHDVGVSQDGESLWVLAQEMIPADGVEWEGFVVKQLDRRTGETVWAWSSMDDGVASGALEPGDRYDTAPYHANAVWDVVENGVPKLYVSLRNENAVLRIDVATRAVDLHIGIGGDLVLLDADGQPADDAEWFFGQHDTKRLGDRLVVYDNGLGRNVYGTAPFSRALVLALDEAAGTARIEASWRDDGEWISPAWGGLDRRDDGTLDLAIGHFWWVDQDATDRSGLALLAPDGADATVRWRVDFPDRDVALYRSDRLDPVSGCVTFPIEGICE